jgi:hypothetical protein
MEQVPRYGFSKRRLWLANSYGSPKSELWVPQVKEIDIEVIRETKKEDS